MYYVRCNQSGLHGSPQTNSWVTIIFNIISLLVSKKKIRMNHWICSEYFHILYMYKNNFTDKFCFLYQHLLIFASETLISSSRFIATRGFFYRDIISSAKYLKCKLFESRLKLASCKFLYLLLFIWRWKKNAMQIRRRCEGKILVSHNWSCREQDECLKLRFEKVDVCKYLYLGTFDFGNGVCNIILSCEPYEIIRYCNLFQLRACCEVRFPPFSSHSRLRPRWKFRKTHLKNQPLRHHNASKTEVNLGFYWAKMIFYLFEVWHWLSENLYFAIVKFTR